MLVKCDGARHRDYYAHRSPGTPPDGGKPRGNMGRSNGASRTAVPPRTAWSRTRRSPPAAGEDSRGPRMSSYICTGRTSAATLRGLRLRLALVSGLEVGRLGAILPRSSSKPQLGVPPRASNHGWLKMKPCHTAIPGALPVPHRQIGHTLNRTTHFTGRPVQRSFSPTTGFLDAIRSPMVGR